MSGARYVSGVIYGNNDTKAKLYKEMTLPMAVLSRPQAGRGTFSQGSSGWRMAPVSTPRGKSFEDAKLRFEDVQQALQEKSGTVRLHLWRFEPPRGCIFFSTASGVSEGRIFFSIADCS